MEQSQGGFIRLGSFLKTESVARRAIDRAHAQLDENAFRALDTPGARFAMDLDVKESMRRAKAYTKVALEDYVQARRA
jgi:hypothetical protein